MIERRTAIVTIYQGDYLDRIRHLEQKAEAAREAADAQPRMNDEIPEWVTLAEQHDALVAEAEESAVNVKVQALKRSDWKALIAEHPPREGNKSDEYAGANEDTFKEALVPVSIIGPADFGEDDIEALSEVDFDRVYIAAYMLNRGAVAAPKASLVSRMTTPSDETSN